MRKLEVIMLLFSPLSVDSYLGRARHVPGTAVMVKVWLPLRPGSFVFFWFCMEFRLDMTWVTTQAAQSMGRSVERNNMKILHTVLQPLKRGEGGGWLFPSRSITTASLSS